MVQGPFHVRRPRRKTRGSECLLPGVQRQRHHREHGDPRREDRLGADTGLRDHRRRRRQRRRHGRNRRRARAHLPAGAGRSSSDQPRLRCRPADRIPIRHQGIHLLYRWRCTVRPGGAGGALAQHDAGRGSRERLQDQPRRSATPHPHRTDLPPHRQPPVRPEAARRRLRFPPAATRHFRAHQPRKDERDHLRRDDEEDSGRRLPHRRGAGASLPPRVRQVRVFQFPAPVQDRQGPAGALGRARGPPQAPAARHHSARQDHGRPGRPRLSESAAAVTAEYRELYRDRAVMITGGLGFIGSNLARRLVELGADVLLVDSLIPDSGGNLFNIDGIADRVRVNVADIRQQTTMNHLVRDRDVIFSLAGQVSHIDSMRDPYTDLEINCRSQLTVLEACRNHNPRVKVVFAGTRQVYGRPESLPVDETHLVRPTDVNGINKAAGEYYHLVYNNVFGVRSCSLRLTNVYGPRQLLKHSRQGFIGWFVRLVLENNEIQIFGDGTQLRDFVYVDDAVDAFLRAGADEASNGEAFNVGGLEPIRHRDLVELMIRTAGSGRFKCTSWPPEKKAIDIGDFYADSSKIRATLGWRPTTPLAEGLKRTFEFYRAHFDQYVPATGEQVASL